MSEYITREEFEAFKEDLLKSLPALMLSLSLQYTDKILKQKLFYRRNPDLEEHRVLMGTIITRIDLEDPLLPYEEKLEKASKEVREIVFAQTRAKTIIKEHDTTTTQNSEPQEKIGAEVGG